LAQRVVEQQIAVVAVVAVVVAEVDLIDDQY